MSNDDDAAQRMVRRIERYLAHIPTTTDQTLLVLKGHLLIEELLSEIIDAFLPHPRFLADARLTFVQRFSLARSMCWGYASSDMWPLIAALNTLRNELAHNLDAPKADEKLQRLVQSFLSSIEDKAFRGEMKQTPADQQLRSVILYAIGFLGRFLEDVHAYRGTVDPLQLDPNAPRLADRKPDGGAPAV